VLANDDGIGRTQGGGVAVSYFVGGHLKIWIFRRQVL